MNEKLKLKIGPHDIFDATIAKSLLPVGVQNSYPNSFLKNVLASAIACQLGNNSVDYVRKKYLSGWEKEDHGIYENTLDTEITHSLKYRINYIEKIFIQNSFEIKDKDTKFLFDLTCIKSSHTLDAALNLAAQGRLSEVLVLCRNVLEMISWLHSFGSNPDFDELLRKTPEKTIRHLRKYAEFGGKYYGFLSGFAHWYDFSHLPHLSFGSEYVGFYKASSKFKWLTIANILLLLSLLISSYHEVSKIYHDPRFKFDTLWDSFNENNKEISEWVDFFSKIENPYCTEDFSDIMISASNHFKKHTGFQ